LPFRGWIDLIDKSRDTAVSIENLKTVSEALSDSNAHSNRQFTAYSLGAESLGFDLENPMFKFDVVLETDTTDMVRHGTRRTKDEPHRLIKLFYEVTRLLGQTEPGIRGQTRCQTRSPVCRRSGVNWWRICEGTGS